MAKPDTDEGFVMVALDLWGAIMTAGFNDYERLILAEVIAQVYGREKSPSARIDLSSLAEMTRIDRRNLKRALRTLIAAGVLIQRKDGSFSFVKDWEKWTVQGESLANRLLGGLVSWAFSLVHRFGVKPRGASARKQAIKGADPTPEQGVQSNPSGGSIEPLSDSCDRGSIEPPSQLSQGFNPTPQTN